MLQRAFAFFCLVLCVKRRTIRVRPPKFDDAWHRRFCWPTTWVASQLNRATCCTVVTAVRGENFVAASVKSCHAHCILCCLCATVSEKHHVQIARCKLCNQASCFTTFFVCVKRSNSAHLVNLCLDGFKHLWVLMSNVHIDQLA